ncbi:hypothetical protein COEREDRAFT_79593 [Coemansia reversa NRRL 1564]|uniref:Uncharacterized protein n=1 Tax=Coemansia reversa (strain ATCC 12441 / NRRL 1564) TaxID=763665 RepID=A0A2G5BHQ3_COERN|nr:hypothetical protein COEREDRAFT_79593 [Coemansia reversa NRRL 1564]|eukprot:PIA18539.1 hypothetical protein COEREDRAFT_79593 [Coemansia reversa NRRL 1564]
MKLVFAIAAFTVAVVVQAQNDNLDAPTLPPGAYSPDFISGPGTGLPPDATDGGIAAPSPTFAVKPWFSTFVSTSGVEDGDSTEISSIIESESFDQAVELNSGNEGLDTGEEESSAPETSSNIGLNF